jgi:3-dehydroquinate synthase
VTPAERAARIEALLDALELAAAPLPVKLDRVVEAMSVDKKVQGGRLRWVLPTGTAVTVRSDVPADLVRSVSAGVLAGRGSGAR